MLDNNCGIILAADVEDLVQLRELSLLAECKGVQAVKIGFSLALRVGLKRTVDVIKDYCGLPVIYDHQKAGTDIPRMGEAFADVCKEAGVDAAIIFPLSGPSTLLGFVCGLREREVLPIVGLTMTHDRFTSSEGGWISDDASERIAAMAGQLHVRHFVLPGTKPKHISYFSEIVSGFEITTAMFPGIGSQGGTIAEAFAASNCDRNYAIVGSAIYKSECPDSVMEDLVRQAEEAS